MHAEEREKDNKNSVIDKVIIMRIRCWIDK